MDLKVQIDKLEKAYAVNETCIFAMERTNIAEDNSILDTMRITRDLLDELIDALKTVQAEG